MPASIVYFGVRDESEGRLLKVDKYRVFYLLCTVGGSYLSESLIKDVKTFAAAESIAAERAARHAVK